MALQCSVEVGNMSSGMLLSYLQVRPPLLKHPLLHVKTICTSCLCRNGATNTQDVEKSMPLVKDVIQAERRRKFWEMETEFETRVDLSRLNDTEKLIHAMHAAAVARGHFTYDDPVSGDRVLTRLRHFLKGACCGSACRHCIYDHAKVSENKKANARFNTAFWVYEEEAGGKLDLGDHFNSLKPMPRKTNATATHWISVKAVNAAEN